ncbi:hypothetical protein MOX02_45220 [Methylobacterium oxalidis]|uniref:Uncharacterized protein n=1 Tax=Methylobacterium oxalidis TaxID=944322 RepID=A0A512J937_9HYPH|nr:hypothetical protein MOX02_45220 [Methylobacterium oxalidis]GLS65524.1 hypothetical protein GCM10007888_39060 [Methylobacterium oxalidis]
MHNPFRRPTQDELRRRALKAARDRLNHLQRRGEISEQAVQVVEDELRRIELRAFLGRLYPH